MIFRLTQKMGKKIGVAPEECLPREDNPYLDWCAHLFRAQRVQYVILTNTASLYSMLMFGRGLTDHNKFLQTALRCMDEFMRDDGFGASHDRLIAPHTGPISFSKVGDRRVLGSMNDLVHGARFYLIERELSPYEASFHLNETPLSLLDYGHPREAFRSLRVEREP